MAYKTYRLKESSILEGQRAAAVAKNRGETAATQQMAVQVQQMRAQEQAAWIAANRLLPGKTVQNTPQAAGIPDIGADVFAPTTTPNIVLDAAYIGANALLPDRDGFVRPADAEVERKRVRDAIKYDYDAERSALDNGGDAFAPATVPDTNNVVRSHGRENQQNEPSAERMADAPYTLPDVRTMEEGEVYRDPATALGEAIQKRRDRKTETQAENLVLAEEALRNVSDEELSQYAGIMEKAGNIAKVLPGRTGELTDYNALMSGDVAPVAGEDFGVNDLFWLDPNSQNRYLYLWKTQGKKVADAYLESQREQIEAARNTANAARTQGVYEEGSNFGTRAAALESNVFNNLVGSFGYMGDVFAQNAVNNIDGTSNIAASTDTASGRLLGRAQEDAALYLEGLEGAPRFLAETGLNLANNVLVMPLAAISPAIPGAIMGVQAAANSAYDVAEQGGTSTQQIELAVLSGLAEGIGEAFQFGKLMDIVNNPMARRSITEFAKKLGSQALVEGGSEGVTEILNIIAEAAVLGDEAQLAQFVQQYLEEHPDEQHAAYLAVAAEALKRVGKAFGMGAITGGLMGGGASAVNYANAPSGEAQAGPFVPDSRLLNRGDSVLEESGLTRAVRERILPGPDVSPGNSVLQQAGEMVEATTIDDNPMNHTPQQQRVIEEYTASVDPGLLSYVQKVNSKQPVSASYEMGSVGPDNAARIKEITGVDTTGFQHIISLNNVQHIEKRHGKNGKADHSMANYEDVARIGFTLEQPDNITALTRADGSNDTSRADRNSDGTQAKKIIYEKAVDGKMFVVEVVPDNNRKQLRVISAYMNNGKQMANAQNGPALTSDNASASRISKSGGQVPNATSVTARHTADTDAISSNLAEGGQVPHVDPSQGPLGSTTGNGVASSSNQSIPQSNDSGNTAQSTKTVRDTLGQPTNFDAAWSLEGGEDILLDKALPKSTLRERLDFSRYLTPAISNPFGAEMIGEKALPGKRSKFISNTMENSGFIDTALREIIDLGSRGLYNVVSETQTLKEAAQRVSDNPAGELHHIMTTTNKTGADFDAGMITANQLREQGNTRGYALALDAMAADSTASGQFIQAHAKWSRTTEGAVVAVSKTLNNIVRQWRETHPRRANSIDALAKEVGRAVRENSQSVGDGRYGTVEQRVRQAVNDSTAIKTRKGKDTAYYALMEEIRGGGRRMSEMRNVLYSELGLPVLTGDNLTKVTEAYDKAFAMKDGSQEQTKAFKEISRMVSEMVPSSVGAKASAMRYLAMLLNPTTHVRNFMGNVLTSGLGVVDRSVGGVLEDVFARRSENRGNTAINPFSKEYRALYKEASNYVKQNDAAFEGEGKFADAYKARDTRDVFGKKTAAQRAANRIFNALSDFNTFLLNDIEDGMFSRFAARDTFARHMAANNITAEMLRNYDGQTEAVQAKIREGFSYGVEQGLRMVYRDANVISDMLASASATMAQSNNILAKGAHVAIESVFPFKRTPANILMRGVEYSPVGLVKSLTHDLVLVSRGSMTPTQAINNITSGMSGTAIMGLGVFLASQGLLRAGGSDDDKENLFERMMGKQNYALVFTVGDKEYTYTLDWAAPAAMPLFVGAELATLERDGDMDLLNAAFTALSSLTDPMIEMSMLQGLQNILEYSDSPGDMVNQIVANYVSQFFPTLGGKINNMLDPTARVTTPTAEGVAGTIERTARSVMNKIPGLSQLNEASIDLWGNEVSRGNMGERAFESFASPGYLENVESTPVDEELLRLSEALGTSDMLPDKVPQNITVNGERVRLSAKELTSLAKEEGQLRYSMLESLMGTSEYNSMTDEAKTEAIRDMYSYAHNAAKKTLFGHRFTDEWMQGAYKASDPARFIVARDTLNSIEGEKDVYGNTIQGTQIGNRLSHIAQQNVSWEEKEEMLAAIGYSLNDKYSEAVMAGVPNEIILDFAAQEPTVTGDKNAEGKTISGSERAKKLAIISSYNLPYEQAIELARGAFDSDKSYDEYRSNVYTAKYYGVPDEVAFRWFAESAALTGEKDADGDSVPYSRQQKMADLVSTYNIPYSLKELLLYRSGVNLSKVYFY